MDDMTVGNFVIIQTIDSIKVAYLKSLAEDNQFYVDWFVFAQEIAAFYPNQNLPAFDDSELFYVDNNDLPKSISKEIFLRPCSVQFLSHTDSLRPERCSLDEYSFFVRYRFDGSSLTCLPDEFFQTVPATPQRVVKNSKKIVRVSFVGVEDQPLSPMQSPKVPFRDTVNVRLPILNLEKLSFHADARSVSSSPSESESEGSDVESLASQSKKSETSDGSAVISSNLKTFTDSPPRTPTSGRTPRTSKTTAINAISATFLSLRSPDMLTDHPNQGGGNSSHFSKLRMETDPSTREVVLINSRISGIHKSPLRSFPSRRNKSNTGSPRAAKIESPVIKPFDRTPHTNQSQTMSKTPTSSQPLSKTPKSATDSSHDAGSPNHRQSSRTLKTIVNESEETPTRRQPSRTPGSTKKSSRTPRTPLDESEETPTRRQPLRTPGSTKKSSRTPRTPLDESEETPTRRQPLKTPGSTKQSSRTPRTPLDESEETPTRRQPLKTPGSTKQTSRTPRTPLDESEETPTRRQPLKTPGSTKQSSRTPRTPLDESEETPTRRQPLKTPGSTKQTSRTPRTPLDESEETPTRRQPLKTPGSTKQSSRTPRTPLDESEETPTRRQPLRTPGSTKQSSRKPRTPLDESEETPTRRQPLKTPGSTKQSSRTPRTPLDESGETPTRRQPSRTPGSTKQSSRTPRTPLDESEETPTRRQPSRTPGSTKQSLRTSRNYDAKHEEIYRTVVVQAEVESDGSSSQSRKRKSSKSEEFSSQTVCQPSRQTKRHVEATEDDIDDDPPLYRQSARACKTAALKKLLAPDPAVLMTHTFPQWKSTFETRKKLFGRRRSEAPSQLAGTPMLRMSRLALDDLEAGRDRNVSKRLAGFRRSHRRTEDDSTDDDDNDEDFLPSSDSDSDFEEALGRRKRRPQMTPVVAKRRRGEDEDEVSLPTRATSVPAGEKRAKPRGCKIHLVQFGMELEEAKLRLHVANYGPDRAKALTCREAEFDDIFQFVSSRLRNQDNDDGGCMYISGLPGTGKTATVTAVVAALRNAKPQLPDFDFVEVNGMRLTDPQQVYAYVLRQLTGNRCTVKHAAQLLDKEFKKRGRRPCLLIVDELDLLCTRRQQVLYNLFDWPQRASARLTVLAIANTMDLPERLLHQKVASRLGLTRLVFQPYSHKQLHCIVSERLKGIDCFQKEALELTSRKVAAISGDARRALDICRRAVELAEGSSVRVVNLRHVDAAIKEMFASSKVQAISECSVYEQMCLRALLAELVRTGLEEAQLDRVVRQMDTLCRCEGLPLLTGGEVFTVMVRLSSHKLVLCEHFRQDGRMKLRLNCAQHDVTFALKDVKYEGVLTND